MAVLKTTLCEIAPCKNIIIIIIIIIIITIIIIINIIIVTVIIIITGNQVKLTHFITFAIKRILKVYHIHMFPV